MLRSATSPNKAAALTLRLALAALALLWAAGCATPVARLPQKYDENGIPHSYKRMERYTQRDFWHHWVRTAYCRPNIKKFAPPVGSDQALIYKQWGRPDWIRKPFHAVTDECVQEWVYLDKTRIFQFIGNQLVFEGPLRDYEQTLVLRGYPDRAMQIREEDGTTVEVFIYYNLFLFFPRLDEFHFANGMITQSQEGN